MTGYNYKNISDYFIALSNETQNLITNLKMQKLMYYSQAHCLASTGKRMFEGEFQAWVHGPVMFDLYSDYKLFRWNPIVRDDLDGSYESLRASIDPSTIGVLDFVTNKYFGLTAYELERLTHLEEPWRKARLGLAPDEPSNNIIQDAWMEDYYKRDTLQN